MYFRSKFLLGQVNHSSTMFRWNRSPSRGSGLPISRVRIVVRPSLIERAPDVIQFLLKWDLNTETQVLVEEKYGELNSLEDQWRA